MIATRAPFRISFFGGGTDYPAWFEKHGGAVLSTSIDKYCYIICRHLPPFFDTTIRVAWSKVELANHIDEIQHPTAREAMRYLGFESGVEIQISTDLPARSGIGSSSSFTVAVLQALYALKGHPVNKYQLALDAMHVEQNMVGDNVGCQDQVAAAFGGLNRINFGGPHRLSVETVAVPQERLLDFKRHLMLFFTGFSRTSSEVAAGWVKNVPHNASELMRMGNMVDEGVEILTDSGRDLNDFGRLLDEAWRLKRRLAGGITTPQVEEIYKKAVRAGALGGKLLGAGGGGFILLYVKPPLQEKVRRELKDLLYVPFDFEDEGAKIVYQK